MMDKNEIKANYLDISKLIENFEKVQKPINEMVNNLFEGSRSYNITTTFSNLAGHYLTQKSIGASTLLISFFYNKEAGMMMNEKEIKASYLDIYTDIFKLKENFEKVQKPTNDVVGKVFENPLVAGMTLAEISAATDESKTTADAVKNDFPKVIELLGKVKISHPEKTVGKIVYTVASGTFDWPRGNENDIKFHSKYDSIPGCYRFTIIHRHKFDLSVGPAKYISGVNTVTYINDMIPSAPDRIRYPIRIDINTSDGSVVRDSLPWTLEFVSGIPPPDHKSEYIIE